MSKRPIPILKKEDELESFIHMIEEAKEKKEDKKEIKTEDKKENKKESIKQVKEKSTDKTSEKSTDKAIIKKSLVLSEEIDSLLRIKSAKTRKTQNEIIEEALKLYFDK